MIKIVLSVAVAYVGIMAFMFLFQRHFTFQPSGGHPFDTDHAPFRAFAYDTPDGLTLRGLYAPAAPGKPTLIYMHGNAGHLGDRLYKAKHFIPNGYGMVLVGYRGYSGNPGQPTEQGLYTDARTAIRSVMAGGVAERDIILYGESLGTGVATQMATEFPNIRALVLEAPFTSAADVARGVYFFLPIDLLMKDRFDSVLKIGRVTAPVLIVHGTADRTVPYKLGRRLFDNVTAKKRDFVTVDGAGHADLYEFDVGKMIYAFLSSL